MAERFRYGPLPPSQGGSMRGRPPAGACNGPLPPSLAEVVRRREHARARKRHSIKHYKQLEQGSYKWAAETSIPGGNALLPPGVGISAGVGVAGPSQPIGGQHLFVHSGEILWGGGPSSGHSRLESPDTRGSCSSGFQQNVVEGAASGFSSRLSRGGAAGETPPCERREEKPARRGHTAAQRTHGGAGLVPDLRDLRWNCAGGGFPNGPTLSHGGTPAKEKIRNSCVEGPPLGRRTTPATETVFPKGKIEKFFSCGTPSQEYGTNGPPLTLAVGGLQLAAQLRAHDWHRKNARRELRRERRLVRVSGATG